MSVHTLEAPLRSVGKVHRKIAGNTLFQGTHLLKLEPMGPADTPML